MASNRRGREIHAREERKRRRKAGQVAPGGESVYARKRQGIYPPNSPYLTGSWGCSRHMLRTVEEVGR